MSDLPRPLSEPATDRRNRQLDYFRRAADRAMRAIDIASQQLETAHAAGQPGATAAPNIELARATRTLVLAVTAENCVLSGQAAPRAPANDRRRPLLREALHKAADAEPSPKARAALHRDIDDRIEETLLADPAAEIELTDHLFTIAEDLGLAIDVATLRDEVLGIHIPTIPQPGSHFGSADTGDPFDD